MSRRLAVFAGVAALLFGGGYALTQPGAAPKPKDDQPVRDTLAAYAAAFNTGDADAVLAFWADDAELIDEDGVTRAKPAISAGIKAVCKPGGGAKMVGSAKTVKLVGGTVALADGAVELTTAEGTETNSFEAVLVKNAQTGAWQFSRVRDLPGAGDAEYAPAYAKLKSLEWLVGEWAAADGDQSLAMTVKWMRNRAYLVAEQTVKMKDKEVVSLTMMIGYDPVSEMIHSWVFDTHGGRGEADWTREGNTWAVEAVGLTGAGEESASKPVWKFVDDATFEWASAGRQVNGQPRPDIKLTYRKVAAPK